MQTYNQILQRFLLQQENRDQTPVQVQIKPPPLPKETSDPVEVDVMTSLPKSFHAKAKYLLTRLRNDPTVDWNGRGEVVLDHHLIPGSNLADLINDVLRDRKSPFEPVGSLEFANHLHAMNVPQEFIGNKARMRTPNNNKRKRSQNIDSPLPNKTSVFASLPPVPQAFKRIKRNHAWSFVDSPPPPPTPTGRGHRISKPPLKWSPDLI